MEHQGTTSILRSNRVLPKSFARGYRDDIITTRTELAAKEVKCKWQDYHKKIFDVGERILLKANRVGGRRIDNTAKKFFRLYEGPYVLRERVGRQTLIVYGDKRNKLIAKIQCQSVQKLFSVE